MTEIKWSSQQKAFFNHVIMGRGNGILRARAGTGKTATIVESLNRCNVSSALYIVFNKKNQIEAEKKILNKNVSVKTAHSVGFSFILKNWRGVRASGYTEYKRIKEIYPDAPEQVIFQAAKLVSYLKNTFVEPNKKNAMDTCLLRDLDTSKKNSDMGWTMDKLADMALDSIEKSLSYPKDRLISFDDMIFLPVRLGWLKPSYMMVFGDESQDFNLLQFKMIQGCCLPNGKIYLVADDRQCIYFFRGAEQNGLDDFKIKLSATEFPLTVSYRCPKSVISLAKTIVPDIEACETAIEGEIIDCNFDEALKIIKVNDIILSRNNFALMKSCLTLLRKGIPSYIEGRDLGAKLEQLIDSLEPIDLNDFFVKLDSWLAVHQAKTGYNAGRRIEEATDTHATLRVLSETCLTIQDLKDKLNKLFMDANSVRVPSVINSTVHRAKGGQWRNVFILMETFAPGRRVLSPAEQKEELNIKYVGISRSMEKLIRIN
jgi:superfamily I DNA/RNA helicase